MVGLLCSQTKERLFADHIRRNADLTKQNVPVIVFSMPNINLSERTVYGTVISDGKLNEQKTELPGLIFNFAVQHTKSHLKKLKCMSELENLTLINPANSFNQWLIMKMLSSDSESRQYLLPYTNISSGSAFPDFQEIGSFILKSRSGSDPVRTIYCRKTKTGFDLFNIGDTALSHLSDIQNVVIPILKSGKWVILQSPELMTYRNRLLIIRSYLYKNSAGKWEAALKTVLSQTEEAYRKTDKKTDEVLLRMMNYINCFIPDLAFCTVDFAMNMDGTPYFLSLGGWQDLSPKKALHGVLADILCENIAAYAKN
jgi:hypothetical protein